MKTALDFLETKDPKARSPISSIRRSAYILNRNHVRPTPTEIRNDDIKSGDYLENTLVALKSRLEPGATAEQLGFNGFEGKTVVDVGTYDGRDLPIIKELGAEVVYGLDPDKEGLETAISSGKLDPQLAINKKIQNLPEELKGSFDVVTAFNVLVGLAEIEEFVAGIYDTLKPEGQVVATFVETETFSRMIDEFNMYFRIKAIGLQDTLNDQPNNILLIGEKRETPVSIFHNFS